MADVSHTLLCIIEESIVYYGLVDTNHVCLHSDLLTHFDTNSLFDQPSLVTQFLKKSLGDRHFQEIKYAIVNPHYSLIPKEVSTDSAHLWTVCQKNTDDRFHIDEMSNINLGYYLPARLEDELSGFAPQITHMHIASSMLKCDGKRNGVHSYILSERSQWLHVVKDNQTHHSSIVRSESELSRMYYSLLAFEMNELDAHHDTLYLSSQKALREELVKYVCQVEAIHPELARGNQSPLTEGQFLQLEKLLACAS